MSNKGSPRGDAELMARNRVLIAFLLIYMVCMGFMMGADALIGARGGSLLWARLAVLPLFALLLRFWLRAVRVRPPRALLEVRQLSARGRHASARDQLDMVDPSSPEARKLDRARRLLQDGLAVPVAHEVNLERGRLSLLLGETERAVQELTAVAEALPHRAEIGIDLADALARDGRDKEAGEALLQALPHMDAVDLQTVREQPSLLRLLGHTPLPTRSRVASKIKRERLMALALLGVAIAHGVWFYLG